MEEKTKKVLLYVIGILIVILAVLIILPAFQKRSGRHSPKLLCQLNNRSLSICCQLYHWDEDSWPSKTNWCDLIKPHLYGAEIYLKCPKDKIGPCSYAMNENIPDDTKELPDDMVLLFESTPGWNKIGGPDDVVTNRHKKPGANIGFVNGDVKFIKTKDIPNLRWTVEEE